MLFKIVTIILFLIFFGYSNDLDQLKLYRIDDPSHSNIIAIEKIGGDISRYFPNNFAEVYLNQTQFDDLNKMGFSLSG